MNAALASTPLSDPTLDYEARPSLRRARHLPAGALAALVGPRRVHAVREPGAVGEGLSLFDLETGQRRRVRWFRGEQVQDSDWVPALSPGQAAARQLDRWLSLFAWEANQSQRAALIGETTQNYHNILKGARGCSLRKVAGWVATWNRDTSGPTLALDEGRVSLG